MFSCGGTREAFGRFSLVAVITAIASVISVVFLVVYIPLALQNCASNLVEVDYYVENADCTCTFSVGNMASLGYAMVANYTGLPLTGRFQGTNSQLPVFAFGGNNSTDATSFEGTGLSYFSNYFGIEFSNAVVHTKQISWFTVYNNLDLSVPLNLNPFNAACIVESEPMVWVIGYDTTQCLDYLATFQPDVEPLTETIELGYDKNMAYREYCKLAGCAIPMCTGLATLNVLLFAASIISFIFTLSRLVLFLCRSWMERRDKVAPQGSV